MSDIHIGSWVQFMENGRLVIGEVRYITEVPSWDSAGRGLVTSAGIVSESRVYEVRNCEEELS